MTFILAASPPFEVGSDVRERVRVDCHLRLAFLLFGFFGHLRKLLRRHQEVDLVPLPRFRSFRRTCFQQVDGRALMLGD